MQIDPLGTAALAGEFTEQRGNKRTECYLRAVAPGKSTAFRRVVTVDLSERGARLIVEPPPQLGETLRWMYVLDGDTIFWIEATVVHIDGVSVGCRFARALYRAELEMLLATANTP
jgi:hypothetical protein